MATKRSEMSREKGQNYLAPASSLSMANNQYHTAGPFLEPSGTITRQFESSFNMIGPTSGHSQEQQYVNQWEFKPHEFAKVMNDGAAASTSFLSNIFYSMNNKSNTNRKTKERRPRSTNFSHKETLELIDIWSSPEILSKICVRRPNNKYEVWNLISFRLAQLGHQEKRTADQCRNRFQNLMNIYNRVKNSSSAGQQIFPYYDLIRDALEAKRIYKHCSSETWKCPTSLLEVEFRENESELKLNLDLGANQLSNHAGIPKRQPDFQPAPRLPGKKRSASAALGSLAEDTSAGYGPDPDLTKRQRVTSGAVTSSGNGKMTDAEIRRWLSTMRAQEYQALNEERQRANEERIFIGEIVQTLHTILPSGRKATESAPVQPASVPQASQPESGQPIAEPVTENGYNDDSCSNESDNEIEVITIDD